MPFDTPCAPSYGGSRATRVARAAPRGVRATLRSAWKAEAEGVEAAYAALAPEMQGLFGSADAQEGLMSLLERRDARFAGR